MGGSVIGAPASVIGAPTMGTHVLSHMPMGLPPGTPSTSRVVMSTGMPMPVNSVVGMHHNGVPVSMAPVMSHPPPLPPLPNGIKKNYSTDSLGDHGSASRPVTPTQLPPPQPLGLPNGRGKLVPGRMSNHKLD